MATRRLLVLLRYGATLAVMLALTLWPAMSQAADTGWRGEYFANPSLSGSPALVRTDPELSFNWGLGAPAPGLPADSFSVRWTRTVHFEAGQWRFNVTVDDGVRLLVDGQSIIDQWRVTAPITYTSSTTLTAGDHLLQVEYWENTERAQVRLWWEPGGPAPTNQVQLPQAGAWRGQYFDNRYLSDDPTFTRDDAAIYFNWGAFGPGGGVDKQDFSVRWTRKVNFPDGNYQFQVHANDGVRVWLDWKPIIDQWHDFTNQTYHRDVDISAGDHWIVVEYYQGLGNAEIQFSWQNTDINWVGNLITCMRPKDSWIKVYRLAPDNQWVDLKPSGYGPIAANGELKLFGLPVDASYGWDGQPYRVELWAEGRMLRSDGNFFAGQPELRLAPGQTKQTSWGCGAAIP